MAKACLIFTIFFICCAFSSARFVSQPQLELVQVLFRHGHRTPLKKEEYPNDPNRGTAYPPWGYAQLTNDGKMCEYDLGRKLREQYGDFLGRTYNPNHIHAYSSNRDRTKASLQLVLAGLYPPSDNLEWNDNLKWSPIPTNNVPGKLDMLLNSPSCPKYKQEQENVYNIPEIKAVHKEYQEFIDFLSEKTGIYPLSPFRVYELHNCIFAQKKLNLPLPEWLTDEVFQTIVEITEFQYQIFSRTPLMKRLNGGPMIRRFIENMDILERRPHPRKMYLYGGHETNIAGIILSLNMTLEKLPAYGSAIIFEKYSDDNNRIFIQMKLWSGCETKKLTTLKLNNCSKMCPLDKYLQISSPTIPTDDEMRCLINKIKIEDLEKILVTDLRNDDAYNI